MSSNSPRVAAVWPLKATKKTDYVITSVEHIRDFQERKKYGQDLFKFKPPGAQKSSLVFILLTGCK